MTNPNQSESRLSSALRRNATLKSVEFRCVFSVGHGGRHIYIAVPKGRMRLQSDCHSVPDGERLQELNSDFCDSLCKVCFQPECDCSADSADGHIDDCGKWIGESCGCNVCDSDLL